MTRPRPTARAILLAATALAAASCAKRDAGVELTQLTQQPASVDVLTPVVRGGANGLEVLWFVCRDSQASLASALAPYLYQPAPLSEESLAALRANGLRLVAVPLADLGALRDGLDMVGVTERAWMGWSLAWGEAFRARTLPRGATVVIDDRLVTLPKCGPRLLARCWSTPTPEGDRVRVELTTQLVPDSPRVAPFDPLARPASEDFATYELTRGEVVPALAFEAELQPGFAYLLVPESPDADWLSIASDAQERERSGETIEDDGFEPADDAWTITGLEGVFGPPAPAPLTLGEAMLTSWDPFETDDSGSSRAPRLKAVVALVPRAESRVRLLPKLQSLAPDAIASNR